MKKKTTPAFTEQVVSDGVFVGKAYRWDPSLPTKPEDFAAIAAAMSAGSLQGQVRTLRERLASLSSPSGATALHVAEIEKLLNALPASSKSYGPEQARLIERANEHWGRILILRDMKPAAQRGNQALATLVKARKEAAVSMSKYTAAQLDTWRLRMRDPRLSKLSLRSRAAFIAAESRLPEAMETIRKLK